VRHPEFQAGENVTTRFIEKNADNLFQTEAPGAPVQCALVAAKAFRDRRLFPSSAPWFGRERVAVRLCFFDKVSFFCVIVLPSHDN
jgi:hypothetical protein